MKSKIKLHIDFKGYYMGRITEVLLVNFSDKYGKFEIEK